MDRFADLQKQGFMKPLRTPKEKPFDVEAWKRRNVEAAIARYASYGPDFFKD